LVLAAGVLASLTLHGGNDQTQPAGTQLPTLLSVKASDDWDNGIEGAAVQWSVTGGEGSLSQAVSTTDTEGLATAVYTLGLHAGTETIAVELVDLSAASVEFAHTATPNGSISGTVTPTNALMSVTSAQSRNTTGDQLSPKISPLNNRAEATVTAERDFEIIENELIVQFRSSALNAPRAGSLAHADRRTAASVSHSIRESLRETVHREGASLVATLPATLNALVRLPDGASAEALKARLAANPKVERVYHNSWMWLQDGPTVAPPTAVTPNDPFAPWQAWHYEMADIRSAWSYTTGSHAVVVAVVDDGIRFDHPDLAPNLTADGYDFVSDNSVPLCSGGVIDAGADGDGWDPDPTKPLMGTYDHVLDCFEPGVGFLGSHGVHVAGTIGARGNDGYGAAGVSWRVSIRPVRAMDVTGRGTSWDIANGIAYAAGYSIEVAPGEFAQASGPAHIINLSLGGPTDHTIYQDAVAAADAAGSLIIASAGNDGLTSPNYPAAYPEVLSVAAVGPDRQPASYTNLAPSVDLFAPGGDYADGGADFEVISTDWDYSTGSPSFNYVSGTSMAAPHVSGVAALLLAREPGLSASQLKSRLINYSSGGILNARNSITQTMSPAHRQFVHLYDAASGAPLATVQASASGSFEFQFLSDGDYFVFAGQDEDGDGITGAPGKRWGAYGGLNSPSSVTVDGSGQYSASFDYGYPIELEPNDDQSNANSLALGGYANGVIESATDVDIYAVTIPTAGTYTFRTAPVAGACGFALEEDTILELYDSGGGLIASNDDVDLGAWDFCSRIETSLQPGTYHMEVSGWLGRPSRYVIESLF
jgi:subtilisin family serine protease